MKIRWLTTPFFKEYDSTANYLWSFDVAKNTGGCIAQIENGQIKYVWYYYLRDITSATYSEILNFMKTELMMNENSISIIEDIYLGKNNRGGLNIKPTIILAGTRERIIMPIKDNFGEIISFPSTKIIPYLTFQFMYQKGLKSKKINPWGYSREQKKRDTIEVIEHLIPKIKTYKKLSRGSKEDVCDAIIFILTYLYLEGKGKWN